MAGLNHEFFLVSQNEHDCHDWEWCINDKIGVIEINDDLIHYMLDTLNWIPAYNPARKETCSGLCLYGSTVIREEGAEIAARILRAWINLFENGPEILQLWQYQQHLQIPREEFIGKLKRLVEFAESVISSNGARYILHNGV